MKRFGPFLLIWCLLLALGVLLGGFGFLDSRAASCDGMAAEAECFEDFEEEAFFDDVGILCVLMAVAEPLVLQSFSILSFSNCSADHTICVHPSGWLMPVRI